MPDFLLELFSEEIPARMQKRAADDLKKLVTGALVDEGLTYEGAAAYATPRRLALLITQLPAKASDLSEERKGPRVGAPDKAIEGFLKGAGLSSLDQAEIVKDEKKGDFYLARIEKKGRAVPDIIAGVMPEIIRKFPWPKSMRWGAGNLRWVRPLHAMLAIFGTEEGETETITFEVDGIKSGNVTFGHRFMSDGEPIKVAGFDDYVARLAKAHVVLDGAVRAEAIANEAKTQAFAQGLELIEDQALLTEVAGLVEWPVVLTGTFDKAFLDMPPEVIRTTIRVNQKCFVLSDPNSAKLANRFVLIANIAADDGGKAVIAGNERVIAARLSDAKFFWDQDREHSLESRLPKLNDLVFHAKLGTVADKTERVTRLAGEIADAIGADKDKAMQAAKLAKADLVTGMVGEFADLQGVMGRYYALNDGLDQDIADAIAGHYAPQGPNDAVPGEPAAIVAALADKLYSLVGFFGIDERPTGSRDPFALRRAALGVIRIILENKLRLNLMGWFARLADLYRDVGDNVVDKSWTDAYDVNGELLAFIAERLKVYLRDRGIRHDLIDAVFGLEGQDDLVLVTRRIEALDEFLKTEDGENLLAGLKRASNIVAAEEKKDGPNISYEGDVMPDLFEEPAEKALHKALEDARNAALDAIDREDFTGAMAAMAKLRKPVDAFFDNVTVNAENNIIRRNRLCLLSQIRATLSAVADFQRLEG